MPWGCQIPATGEALVRVTLVARDADNPRTAHGMRQPENRARGAENPRTAHGHARTRGPLARDAGNPSTAYGTRRTQEPPMCRSPSTQESSTFGTRRTRGPRLCRLDGEAPLLLGQWSFSMGAVRGAAVRIRHRDLHRMVCYTALYNLTLMAGGHVLTAGRSTDSAQHGTAIFWLLREC